MSYAYTTYVDCPPLQDALRDQFLYNPQVTQDPIGALLFVASDLNTNNTLQRQISPGRGKIRAVELTYQPRFTDPSSDSAVINCNGGEEYGNTSQLYEIDPTVGKSRSWTFTIAQFAAACEDDEMWLAKQVQAHMDALARDIHRDLTAFIAANTGEFFDGSTNKDTQTKTTTGAFTEDLTADVVYEWQSIEWMQNQPFVIGDGLVNKYMRAMRAGCCALSGVDLGLFSQQNDLTFLRDKQIGTDLGNPDSFIVLGAGAIQMLTYREFENPVYKSTANEFYGTIIDPKTGIEYDYFAKLDCGVWNFQLKLSYKFVMLPDDSYRINDELNGTNGVLRFTIVNPAA